MSDAPNDTTSQEELRRILGDETYGSVERLIAHSYPAWGGSAETFVKGAVESYIGRLRPDYVGVPPRPLGRDETWP